MKKNRVSQISFLAIFALLLALVGGATTLAQDSTPPNQADAVAVTVTARTVSWSPQIESGGYTLTISGPGGFYQSQTYQPGDRPVLRIADRLGEALPTGVYKYEFQFVPREKTVGRDEQDLAPAAAPVQSGSFSILDGKFVLQDEAEDADEGVRETEGVLAPEDQVILDDLIVDGSLCVGFDCVNGESFGFDTQRLKENNLRIHFQDTSSSASFPTTDWRIAINDSANGGASYFAVQDVDAGRTVFQIEAGAGSNALYVDDYGRVGLGTSTPALELEVRDSDTPSVRLNQDGSSGWSPQTWDVAGNEANFFIRDVTNGSQLPFRIKPGADSNSLYINSDNNIGLGTTSPSANLHVYGSDGTTQLLIEEASGTTALRSVMKLQNNGPVAMLLEDTSLSGTAALWMFGVNTGDIFTLAKPGDGEKFELQSNGNLEIAGTLTQNSNVHSKENFVAVNSRDILASVVNLPISSWNFKFDDPALRHLGPMAQDFYGAFGLGASEEKIAPLDTSGVAFAAIQGLNEIVEEKDAEIAELEARVTALEQAMGVRPASSFLTILPWLLFGILLLVVSLALGMWLFVARKSR